MASISEAPWSGDASNYRDANHYCASSLVDMNSGTKSKGMCHLPVMTPGGALSRAGVHAAASRIGGTKIPSDQKAAAARKLMGHYKTLGEDAPEHVEKMAGVSDSESNGG